MRIEYISNKLVHSILILCVQTKETHLAVTLVAPIAKGCGESTVMTMTDAVPSAVPADQDEPFAITVDDWTSLILFISLMRDDAIANLVGMITFTEGEPVELALHDYAFDAYDDLVNQVSRLADPDRIESLTIDSVVDLAPAINMLALFAAIADKDLADADQRLFPDDFMPSEELLDYLMEQYYEKQRTKLIDKIKQNLPEGIVNNAVEPGGAPTP